MYTCCGHCGKNGTFTEELELETLIEQDPKAYAVIVREINNPYIFIELFGKNIKQHNTLRIPIAYCPVCGRQLKKSCFD